MSEATIICTTCGTEHPRGQNLSTQRCKICDDPRQYVPAAGQLWSEQADLKAHHNVIKRLREDLSIWIIQTEPKFAIGQRCFLIQTEHGNILWDCITVLDETTESFIERKGGLQGIAISHPHYYTTHLEWAKTFNCPVYIAAEDAEWCVLPDPEHRRVLLDGHVAMILPHVEAIKLGGHFPGSIVLRYQPAAAVDALLFIADTIMVAQSGLSPDPRPPGMTSYNFMYSYPNSIPLSPDELLGMWQALKDFDFASTHGAFANQDVWHQDVKRRVLESMQIQARHMGHTAKTTKILQLEL